ncbi:Serine/threonine protein phosphatase [Handroanthus impetiginosus]|uniref:Protein phosphatase n=1 Tax=Handroanthus impetiginosus TaxID=429701 RepID=A0A2G9H3V2_9LAMI|nr:Serine/threonine protein phosphatase [Handroanthus impetiginosus]
MLSNYFSRIHSAIQQHVWRKVTSKESAIQDKIYALTAQEVLLGQSRLVHSLASGIFADLHVFVRHDNVAASQAKLHIANRKKNLSVAGAFSRAFSIPSVSGPSFQVCGYHVDCLLSEPSQGLDIGSEKALMAACGSRSTVNDCSIINLTSRLAQPGVAEFHSFSHSGKNLDNHRKATISLRSKEQPSNFLLYGKGNVKPFLGFGFESIRISSSAFSSAGTARDLPFDNSMREEQYRSSANSSELSIPIDRALKLNSGSCYLPHPDKEETGGEDAHFICEGKHAIGVADGVGGWADLGVDAGKYARELMSNSVNAIQEEPRGSIDPARVLEKAYTRTKVKGSSTACIIALTDEGLHAINLGDSGFMVVRDGCTVFKSPSQQHDFNFTYQLECGNDGDLPSSGQVFTIPVAPGDVIIAGTDGLFDNLYNNDITAVVVHAVRAGFGPQVTAQKIAALARQRAQDKNRQTPFSTAAQEAGFRYYGPPAPPLRWSYGEFSCCH